VRKLKQRLEQDVVKLGAVSFLTDVSSEMIFPLLPLFLSSVLGAPAAVIGLIEGIAESTANVLKLFSGWLSDRLGKRKPFVVAGYGLSCVAKPFFAVANTWPFVLGVRFFDRVGKGIRVTARDVMVADYTTEANRGYAFGFRKAMDSLGAVIGPLLAFALLSLLLASMSVDAAYRTVFWLASIPAFMALAIVLTVREKKRVARPATQPKIGFAVLRANKLFRLNLAIAFLFGLGNFSYAFFVLRAQDAAFTAVAVTLAYAAYNAVYALAAIPAGRLSDKIGRTKVIALGYALFGVACLGFGLASSAPLVWAMFGLYGVFMAIFESVQRAFVSDLVEPGMRGTALGTYQFVVGVSALPASVAAGLLWDLPVFGVRATFVFAAITSFAAAALSLALLEGRRQKVFLAGFFAHSWNSLMHCFLKKGKAGTSSLALCSRRS